jgi:hypothetical protein
LGDEPIFTDAAPLRWASSPARSLWALLGLALFLSSLMLRYLPGVMRLGRRTVPREGSYQTARAGQI